MPPIYLLLPSLSSSLEFCSLIYIYNILFLASFRDHLNLPLLLPLKPLMQQMVITRQSRHEKILSLFELLCRRFWVS